jgi:tripartite-type tricarboxylate transporter receptor subunit TctC
MPLRDWRGIVAPARTPRAIIERLNTEIGKIITNPEFLAQVDPQGMIVAGGSAENLSALIGTDMARWANLVKEAGIKAD